MIVTFCTEKLRGVGISVTRHVSEIRQSFADSKILMKNIRQFSEVGFQIDNFSVRVDRICTFPLMQSPSTLKIICIHIERRVSTISSPYFLSLRYFHRVTYTMKKMLTHFFLFFYFFKTNSYINCLSLKREKLQIYLRDESNDTEFI